MPSHRSCFALYRNLLALAIALSFCGDAIAAGPVCAPGATACLKPDASYALCTATPLMREDYVSDLPKPVERDNLPADVHADTFSSADSEHFTLTGSARLLRGDELLRADRLDYDQTSTEYRARGHVRYQDGSLLMRAEEIHGSNTPKRTQADDVQYQLLSSRGNGDAVHALLRPDDTGTFDRVTYSTCSPDALGWQLRAKRIDLDQKEGLARAHDVTMRLGGVPLLWLPYARFPLDNERHTGFLYPSIGYSSDRGLDLSVPLYLNLAPNYDATLTPRLLSERGLMLGGEFRYLTESSHGLIDLDYLPRDRKSDSTRSFVHAESRTRLAPHWSFNVDINDVSDKRYFEDFGNSLTDSSTRLLPSAVYLRGGGDWWDLAIGGDRYQITDPTLGDSSEPYTRLPRTVFNAEQPVGAGLAWGLRSEAVSFRKDNALEGSRVDLYPYLDWSLQGPWWFVRPELGYRYTGYQLDRSVDDSPDRGTPIASLDSGLVFERDTRLFGNSYTQTLEPRLYYLRVPYRDQSDIPIFDTREQTFDFWQLFSTNRFSGADRQTDANNLTVALTSRLLDDAGAERLSASVGQIRYFDPQRVQLPGRPETDYSGSAYVGQLGVQLNDRWRLNASQQWNPNTDRTDVSTVGLQHLLGNDGVFNFAYRYRRDFLEQFDASTLYPLNERWSLVGRWNFSLRDSRTLEAFAGVQYDSCCVAVRFIGRHYVHNVEGDINNALMLEIEFKGLGAFGANTEDFLHRAILGYH